MQYILTQEEMDSRVPKQEFDKQKAICDALRRLRLKIFQLTRFKCYANWTVEERTKTCLDEGFCDSCPVLLAPDGETAIHYGRLCQRKSSKQEGGTT